LFFNKKDNLVALMN